MNGAPSWVLGYDMPKLAHPQKKSRKMAASLRRARRSSSGSPARAVRGCPARAPRRRSSRPDSPSGSSDSPGGLGFDFVAALVPLFGRWVLHDLADKAQNSYVLDAGTLCCKTTPHRFRLSLGLRPVARKHAEDVSFVQYLARAERSKVAGLASGGFGFYERRLLSAPGLQGPQPGPERLALDVQALFCQRQQDRHIAENASVPTAGLHELGEERRVLWRLGTDRILLAIARRSGGGSAPSPAHGGAALPPSSHPHSTGAHDTCHRTSLNASTSPSRLRHLGTIPSSGPAAAVACLGLPGQQKDTGPSGQKASTRGHPFVKHS